MLFVCADEPESPPGNCHHLGESVDDHGAVQSVHERQVLAFVDERIVDFVRQDEYAVVLGDVKERVIGFLGKHPSRRIRGIVHDYHLRAVGDLTLDVVNVRLEITLTKLVF